MNGQLLIKKKNLINNFSEIKKYNPNSKIMSVIKSNAYGHGILEVAKILNNTDSFAVATIKEAKYLRENNINKEIICLQGFSDSAEYKYCSENNIRPVIHEFSQINIIENTKLNNPVKLWIKIDTGMNRLGFHVSDFFEIFDRCSKNKNIKNPIGVMTHLACADEDEDNISELQIQKILNIIEGHNTEISLFNSAGIIKYSKNFNHSNCWIRPGLMLYGVNPCTTLNNINLKPAMTLTAPVIAIKNCKKGEAIGYGHTYKVKKDTRIAAIGIGYGDGFSRQFSNIGKVFYENNFFNIVGRVSMDIITIDIKDTNINVGNFVELWGDNININEVSKLINTIPYELMCNLGNRLEKLYI